ncbi:MAG: acyl-CoA dehydrogenase family protein [Nitrospirae bacterium]|nr:acyl-CoA dehydrogenase family protein [Nitrospirota bacterium]
MSYQKYFTEEHEVLRQTVKKFVEKEITPHVDQWEEEAGFPREVYRKAGELGLLGVGFPEEYGGHPMDIFGVFVVAEELIRCGAMGIQVGLGTHGIGLPPIVRLGTEEQKRKWVPPVLRGERIAALAVTEPNAGSDVASIQTKAVRDGDFYVVNGAKTFISSGVRADIVTTAVRTGGPGYPGISLLVVEKGTPGFRVSKSIKKMGWWSSDTAELAFEDCRVPVKNLLGEENQGFYGIMVNFQGERLGISIAAVAAAQLAYDLTLSYVRERKAFGKPLTGFQVTRHKLADMATAVNVAREFTYRIAARYEAGEEVVAEVSMAKNFTCQVADKVCYDAVQLHGGYGYSREFVVERLYRDTRILPIGGGTQEIMKEVIAKRLGF